MENSRLNLNTKYKAKISFDDYSTTNDILVSYYLPIIKSEAFSLYSALMIDSRNNMINTLFHPIDRLVSMINLSTDKIEDALSRLEIVKLVELHRDGEDQIIFKLLKPLSPEEFNNSEQFVGLLKSSAGYENLKINNKLFNSMKDFDLDSKENITRSFDLTSSIEKQEAKLNVDFDFDAIKNILNAKQIDWSGYWSDELEEQLLNIIVIYRINSFDIAIELIKEIESGRFDLDNLVNRIRSDFIRNDDINTIISAGENTTEIKMDFLSQLNVRDYFVHRLNRVPTTVEEKMIAKLKKQYSLDDYSINILIDYSVIVNEGAVNKNYIFKIADTILKEKINSPEMLIQHLKVSYKMRKSNEDKTTIDSYKLMEDKPFFE